MPGRTSRAPEVLLRQRAAVITAQRDALLRSIDDMRTSRSLTFADDEHDPEGSTVSLDQARDTALLHQVTHTLTEVEAALERLASGTYGACERCGRAIPEERLRARPEARWCVACAERSTSRRG